MTLSGTDYQDPPSAPPTRSMSAPSVARARLHVVGSSCRFAGMIPAPKPHFERPGFDRRDRSCHGCRLTSVAAHFLVGAAEVTFNLRHVRFSSLPPPSSHPDHVSSRSEAHWHVSADAHPCCVLPAIVWLLVRAQLDECRVPRLAAPIGPSPSHLGGYLGSDGWLGGGEARRFEAGYALCVPRLAAQR